jgi:error-prone DNA polymerase
MRAMHGVEVRPVCVNASRWDCTLEPTGRRAFAVRLGLRMVKGSPMPTPPRSSAPRRPPFASSTISGAVPACRAGAGQLAEADAFRPSLGLARREALWAIKALRDEPLPLF